MKWEPIETAPKDGTKILIVDSEHRIEVSHYEEQWQESSEYVRKAKDGDVFRMVRKEVGFWNADLIYEPTHWMPLPEAPTE